MDKLNQQSHYFEEVHHGILKQVGTGLKILDVGCGYGQNGEEMIRKGNVVFGVDILPIAIEKAKTRLTYAAVADFSRPEEIPEEIKHEKFDMVVFSDILEHVYDPMRLIRNAIPMMKENAMLLVSVPNTANWLNRLRLLFGNWDYAVSGVMDRTHIRFFTLKSIKRLIKEAGFDVINVYATPYILRGFGIQIRNCLFPDSRDGKPSAPEALANSPYYKFYLKYIYKPEAVMANLWKGMFAYQLVITAKPVKPITGL
jgi:2-polyprenyl-3-methyl-5-hydroxy-6-metoxy-1,4-benzoquinol methylase